MRKIDIKNRKETDVTDEALYALYHESYKKWAKMGLDTPWMHCTLEGFCKYLQNALVFVTLDQATNELLGMHCFRGYKKQCRVFGFFLAVSPEVQGEGIASRMLAHEAEFIRQKGYRYLRGVTATTAEWSVQWHLRNDYRIVGYYHSPNDNFANYVFRKQLAPSILWGPKLGPLTARMSFAGSWLVNHVLKHSDGRDNFMGRIARKVLKK